MTFWTLIGGFFVAAGSVLLLTPLVRALARRNHWVDQPGPGRKIHTRPIPRIGGLAIGAGFLAGIGFLAYAERLGLIEAVLPSGALLLGGLVIWAAGFYDDVKGLGFKRKFVVQLFVAYLMLYAGYRIDASILLPEGADPYHQALLSIPLTLFWIVGVINAVNMLDGLDGLAAGVTLIAFASLAAAFGLQGDLGSMGLLVAIGGAVAGFLVYNFNPASIFMGDSGSMLLGFLLAACSLSSAGEASSLVGLGIPVLAAGLPVVDTLLAVVRRVAAGKSPFRPDRDHIHHRIEQRLHSHRKAVLVLYGIGGAFGLAAVLLSGVPPAFQGAVLVSSGALVYVLIRRLDYLILPSVLRLALGRSMALTPETAPASDARPKPRRRRRKPAPDPVPEARHQLEFAEG